MTEPPVPAEASDPRDDPAPLGETVGLLVLSAIAIMLFAWLVGETDGEGPAPLKLLLFGPLGLVFFEVMTNEVWWRRWWGAIPGAIAGLALYFEGRATLEDIIGASWATPVAYVLAWACFGTVFALASRVPLGRRTSSA
ncbi:hypothetical protein ACFFMN_08950 [Planobispora siamensis]|uniref:Uncharacterized protein n=1 Tax=Planobispora siamensis TaxID=936338 RepID=A0A8J3SD01_9ACTN|nr:hypothetical protein [Planobispora siamensis]GIH91109.1 hypothetical protein Psi01_17390 [Planobispora siamensis]